MPFIYRIEQVGNLFGLDVQPTRWLVPPPYSDLQWAAVYGASTLVWLLAFYMSGLYDRRRYSVAWSAVGVTLGFACIVMLVFFFKAYNFSRLAAGRSLVLQLAVNRRLALWSRVGSCTSAAARVGCAPCWWEPMRLPCISSSS